MKSRYLVGIDLGTTNSALSYIDRREPLRRGLPTIHAFPIPQITAPGEMLALPTLPSFLYFLDEHEQTTGGCSLPWHEDSIAVVGRFARDQGTLSPGRLVSSAKSWLCNPLIDRTARVLPWETDIPDVQCSPVEATTGYLLHLCDAWNATFADNRSNEEAMLENQDIVVTVPASFDEEARELTVKAATDAGLSRLTLIEEPAAAFYAWIVAHKSRLKSLLKDGQLVLVCDVGGGTTDFSLISVSVVDGHIAFTRTAVGEHLLLGGDNVDRALAHLVESKLGFPRLSLRQRNALQRQCCAAKELLLSDPNREPVAIHVLGAGRSVIGGTLSAELTVEDVKRVLLDGFLPACEVFDLPKRDRRTALREMGLPYASEPAITKHLVEFLMKNGANEKGSGFRVQGSGKNEGLKGEHTLSENHGLQLQAPSESGTPNPEPRTLNPDFTPRTPNPEAARPDAVLFNGGFFAARVAQDAVMNALRGWFADDLSYKPKTLVNDALDRAVSIGAAYYGHVRAEGGIRVSGGSGRAYHVGLQRDEALPAGTVRAVCVLPRGVEEGTSLELSELDFKVLANRPVSFTLFSSTTRHDRHGELVLLDEAEAQRHAPLVTVLRYGKRSREAELHVRLSAKFTELGTLELWCESRFTEHRWRLQFQLRGGEFEDDVEEESDDAGTVISDEAVEAGIGLIRSAFATSGDKSLADVAPETLVGQLETVLGYGKDAWPTATIRTLCDVLAECAEGRKTRPAAELRWLNLYGFCLRPGFGEARDDWRIKQAWKIYAAGVTFPNDVQCRVEWYVFLGRIAGGLGPGQQLEVFNRTMSVLGIGSKKTKRRVQPQIERDGWRMLANFEHLPPKTKVALGNEVLAKIKAKPTDKSFLWALGRFGARVPFYGQLNTVVPASVVCEWIQAVLGLPEFIREAAETLAQLAARTDDPLRDIPEEARQAVLRKLEAFPDLDELRESVLRATPQVRARKARIFGESLPEGLRLAGDETVTR